MALSREDMVELIGERGPLFGREDLRAIELGLAVMPLDDVHSVEPWVTEAVGLIVASPDYAGDLTIEELEG